MKNFAYEFGLLSWTVFNLFSVVSVFFPQGI